MAEVIITDQNFATEVAQSKLPVLVDFWAPWCGPCRIISPIVEELAGAFEGKIKVGKLNVDENPETAGKFGVMSIPTLLMFKEGNPVDSIVGAQSKETIKQAMEKLISG